MLVHSLLKRYLFYHMEQKKSAAELKAVVQGFPSSPGVYLMKDAAGRIIYIGKAKDLRKRTTSYFTGKKDLKTTIMVSKIDDISCITTTNEYEALLLENNLIKKWKPHYNISLKDGKSFPVIRITSEEYPRVFKTRRIVQDGSEYFGPYADAAKVDVYLSLMEKLYPLRRCRGPLKKRYAPCLYYHIGRCSAPCAGKISREDYLAMVARVRELLKGHTDQLTADLKERMELAASQKRFEEAAELRDSISAVESTRVYQGVEDFSRSTRDYVACVMREHIVTVSVFQMREGKLLGSELHRGESFGDETDALVDFFPQYYQKPEHVPEVIYVSHLVDTYMLEKMLSEQVGVPARVIKPDEGKHYRIMRMVLENAVMDAERRFKAQERLPALEELQRVLKLPSVPRRIEGFDIAHLSGTRPVASLIVFTDGKPDAREYRRFHVKSLDGAIDDYEAIREVTARRYTRVVNEKLPVPGLVLIDGGKGQVNAASEILDSLGLSSVPVAGLAKEFEEIYLPHAREPLRLPEDSEALKLLQAVRDETHRFATTFQTRLREQDGSFSLLESVRGVGPARSKLLMKTYGTLEAIANAGSEDIKTRCRIPLETGERIIEVLRSAASSEHQGSSHL